MPRDTPTCSLQAAAGSPGPGCRDCGALSTFWQPQATGQVQPVSCGQVKRSQPVDSCAPHRRMAPAVHKLVLDIPGQPVKSQTFVAQQPTHMYAAASAQQLGVLSTHPVVYSSLLLVADPPRLVPCLAGVHLHAHTRGWHEGAGVLQAVPAAPTPRGQQAALPPGLWSQPAAAEAASRGSSVDCTFFALHPAAAGCKQTG